MEFIQKVRYLTCKDFSISGCSEEEASLYHAAKAYLASDEKLAEDIATNLYHTSKTPDIKEAATDILLNILLWQNRFAELSQFGIPRNPLEEMFIPFYTEPKRSMKLTDKVGNLDMMPSPIEGCDWALVMVQINSVDIVLMVDTGAAVTVVNESTAKKCGIALGKTFNEATNAVGDKISTAEGMIETFAVGDSTFSNQPCTIVSDSMISFEGGSINGTVGWDIIRELKWELDFKHRKISISAPKYKDVKRNMAYDALPLVTVDIDGNPMAMGLDTGANVTAFGKTAKEFFGDCEETTNVFHGAGSSREERTFIVPQLTITTGSESTKLEKVSIKGEIEYSHSRLFITPGILGFDIATDKIMTVDWFNRHFSIKSSE